MLNQLSPTGNLILTLLKVNFSLERKSRAIHFFFHSYREQFLAVAVILYLLTLGPFSHIKYPCLSKAQVRKVTYSVSSAAGSSPMTKQLTIRSTHGDMDFGGEQHKKSTTHSVQTPCPATAVAGMEPMLGTSLHILGVWKQWQQIPY